MWYYALINHGGRELTWHLSSRQIVTITCQEEDDKDKDELKDRATYLHKKYEKIFCAEYEHILQQTQIFSLKTHFICLIWSVTEKQIFCVCIFIVKQMKIISLCALMALLEKHFSQWCGHASGFVCFWGCHSNRNELFSMVKKGSELNNNIPPPTHTGND